MKKSFTQKERMGTMTMNNTQEDFYKRYKEIERRGKALRKRQDKLIQMVKENDEEIKAWKFDADEYNLMYSLEFSKIL